MSEQQYLSYTSRALSETDGVRPTATSSEKPDLADFIAAHQTAFRRAMAAALRGREDVDDALQQAYLRLMAEYDRWPTDLTDEERLAFAYRAVHLAAKDVLRQEFGRSDRAPKPREIPVDFGEDNREDAETADTASVQLLAQQLLTESAGRYPRRRRAPRYRAEGRRAGGARPGRPQGRDRQPTRAQPQAGRR